MSTAKRARSLLTSQIRLDSLSALRADLVGAHTPCRAARALARGPARGARARTHGLELPRGHGPPDPLPFVVLARLAVVGEAPYGTPECALRWQSPDAESREVDVARDAASARVFLSVAGAGVDVKRTFDEEAWTAAWSALRAQIG